ncbi:unnamed protein product [Ostreobium quekettii]|uniref:Uncharacterized protein n=1 Tax=Ostreobium quekettii TaxID=121088 RepID=A0A8S1IKS4_9CHLO|nr:unnamed protein product [Ostreobium quekettii]
MFFHIDLVISSTGLVLELSKSSLRVIAIVNVMRCTVRIRFKTLFTNICNVALWTPQCGVLSGLWMCCNGKEIARIGAHFLLRVKWLLCRFEGAQAAFSKSA